MQMTVQGQRRLAFALLVIGLAVGGFFAATPPKTSSGAPVASPAQRADAPLADIIGSRELVVLTRNAPTTYYMDRQGRTGFEYKLVKAFAEYLGVRPLFRVKNSSGDILEALEAGEGHLAAAGIVRTPEREARFRVGPAYKQVRQQVVCNRYGKVPNGPRDLAGLSVAVTEKSSHDERLWRLADEVEGLSWTVLPNLNAEELLELVEETAYDCVLADSHVVDINRRYLPDLEIPFDLTEPDDLVWLMPEGAAQLQSALRVWFSRPETQDYIRDLNEEFYGHTVIFDYVDLMAFRRRIENRLPQYAPSFKAASRDVGLPWTLLAAVGYQESHWNPSAVSPTGVRGLMMLTRATASDLGVADRTDADQAIEGGARYLSQLMERIPAAVPHPDRLWFALASYNVGFGHVLDARLLAEKLGKDPNSWADLKTVLPLLSKQKYYQDLPHGYARGNEPVVYVRRIRQYLDVLERHYAQTLVDIGGPFTQDPVPLEDEGQEAETALTDNTDAPAQ